MLARTSVAAAAAVGLHLLLPVVGLPGAAARAEENRFNVHAEVGPLLNLAQPKVVSDETLTVGALHLRFGLEYAFHERVGLELAYSPDLVFTALHGEPSLQQGLAIGVRVRPWWSPAGGYLLPTSPTRDIGWRQVLSDVWVDAHVSLVLSSRDRLAYDLGAGVRVPVTAPVQLGLYARFQQQFPVTGDGEITFKQLSFGVTVSLGFLPLRSEPDSDHDGVPDSRDRCPNTPRGAQVNRAGCTIERLDSSAPKCADTDLDGVCDGADRCPDTPAGAAVDAHGCPTNPTPEPATPEDSPPDSPQQ